MFDYFFKRSNNQPAPAPAEERPVAAEPQSKDKDAALQQAGALSGDESAAVEFILQCQFADARLIAAEHIHDRAMLERVLPHMRKADRRVAKLMQARLDALSAARQREQQAQQCIDTAQKLLSETVLLPNQVGELDRAWQLVGTPSRPMAGAFDNARAQLRARLEKQAQLQRIVIDGTAALRDLSNRASSMSQDEVMTALAQIDAQMHDVAASPEAAALPKNLQSEFDAQRQQFQKMLDSLTEIRNAIGIREEALQRWEAAIEMPVATQLDAAWKALPALPDDEAAQALQQRFAQLRQRAQQQAALAPAPEQPGANKEQRPGRKAKAKTDIGESLEAMEKALQEGAVRAALDIDKQLRAKESLHLSHEQNAHLTRLRAELHHLQGWARWGGNVSREELLRAADELPANTASPVELAKKVGGLRERWKSLDVSSGPASKELWERFDAACTLAYAPAAAHFKHLSDERQANMHKAEAIVAEVEQFAQAHLAEPDWKASAAFCMRVEQAWHRLGTIDRKEKKRLDAAFAQHLQSVKTPLADQQHLEISAREQMITETLALNPADRHAPDMVRALQERWQQRAKAMPLERKDEQALWQKFRGACDTLFAKRKEAASGADAERKQHLSEKEALCAKLEAAHGQTELSISAITQLMREVKDAWGRVGTVPRAQENHIDGRLHKAMAVLQAQIDAAKRVAAENEKNALINKLRLCVAVEQALAASADAEPASADQWQALPALTADVERLLRARFDKGLQAWQSKDAAYRSALEANRTVLLHQLLRLEIMIGLESPAELSRERLQMQVEVLQSTLKNGAVINKRDLLKELCKLPAVLDAQSAHRMEALAGRLNSLA